MEQYAIILWLLFMMIFLSSIATKSRLPYPIFLVIWGIVFGFIPWIKEIQLRPEIIFLIFLPPILYDAAANISRPLFKRHLSTISVLSLSLVFITALVIAVIAHTRIPNMSWPLAFTLGAILSPTDAVAAIAITKELWLTRKTITILEGESLFNDASALTAYHFSLAVIWWATFIWRKAWLEFMELIIWGAIIWLALGKILRIMLRFVKTDPKIAISFTLLMPFIAYLIAEYFHVSWVIAVVVVWLFVAVFTEKNMPEFVKKESKTIWDIVTFLLNGIIFVIIWLNLPYIIKRVPSHEIWALIWYSFLIALGMLAIRLAVVFFQSWRKQRIYNKISTTETSKKRLSWQSVLVISWSGMRWIVSLATALALPLTLADGSLFPQRDIIIFITVFVTLITLLIQWFTLPYLVKLLHITRQDQQ